MKVFAALCASFLIAAPAVAQTNSNTATSQPSAPASDEATDKPAPTISAQRGEAPAAEPAADKPAPEPGAENEAPATPKA